MCSESSATMSRPDSCCVQSVDVVCREQCDRVAALDEFKSGFVRILIATDVASRGLDVKDIT